MTFEPNQKVVFDGRTNIINDRVFAGRTGVVDFQCKDFTFVDGKQVTVPGLVYVKFGRKCVALHPESLQLVAPQVAPA